MFLRLSLDQLYEKLKNKKEIRESKYNFSFLKEYNETNFITVIKQGNNILSLRTPSIELIKYNCDLDTMESIKLYLKICVIPSFMDDVIIINYLRENNLLKNILSI